MLYRHDFVIPIYVKNRKVMFYPFSRIFIALFHLLYALTCCTKFELFTVYSILAIRVCTFETILAVITSPFKFTLFLYFGIFHFYLWFTLIGLIQTHTPTQTGYVPKYLYRIPCLSRRQRLHEVYQMGIVHSILYLN